MARSWTPRSRLAACALAVQLAGCGALADYASDRGADAVDMLRGHVMLGPGADAMIQVTRAARLGAGFYEAHCAGLHNRALGTWDEEVEEGGLLFFHGRFEQTRGIPRVTGNFGTLPPWDSARLVQEDETWVDLFDVRVTAMIGLGIDLELRLGQVLDFVGGLFLWDPARDDGADD